MKNVSKEAEYSYLHAICRIIDFIHPTHALQANVLAYPLYSNQILKRKLVSLGYDTLSSPEDPTFSLDNRVAMEIMRQVEKRLEKEVRCYFEFIVPVHSFWRVGVILSTHFVSFEHEKYPGDCGFSFGFGNSGKALTGGKEYRYSLRFTKSYLESLNNSPTSGNSKVIGILINFHEGNIALVIDGKIQPPAFGHDALSFDKLEREKQKYIHLLNDSGG